LQGTQEFKVRQTTLRTMYYNSFLNVLCAYVDTKFVRYFSKDQLLIKDIWYPY